GLTGSTTVACWQPSAHAGDDGDCDDAEASVNPGATELCNGVDDDCSGGVDEPSAADAPTWYRDNDGDGYGSAAATTPACTQPSGYLADAGDCDDGDAHIHPGADEHCDGVDEDCDGAVDDAPVDAATWHADADGDGYGDPAGATAACTAPSGTVADSSDCDDTSAAVHPGATVTCDGVDDDCDGLVDDEDPGVTGTSTWYADADGDGYGTGVYTTAACAAPSGYVASPGDCDDTEPDAFPGNAERCDGIDNDCDGAVDEADAVDADTWYADTDGDGYGDASLPQAACSQPSGHEATSTDCDDGDPAIHPGAEELCDGVDNDCSGVVDDDPVDGETWYADADGDGYGDAASAQRTCSQPSGTVADATDCDDAHDTAYPGSTATEVPFDGVDQDCDGIDACTDLNCDGLPDLLFPSYRSDSTWATQSRAYYGTGYGFAASHGVALDAWGPLSALVEDLDGDGYQDIVLGGYYNGSSYLVDSYVYWGSAAGYSSADRSTLGTDGVISVRAADLDHDGWTDLAFASHYNGSYATTSMVYWGSAAGFSDADRTELSTWGAYDLEIADLDGDGWDELIFAQYYTGSSYAASGYVYWGSSAGYSSSDLTTLYVTGAVDVEVADLNSDGWLDLVFVSYYSGSGYGSYSYVYWGSPTGPDSTNYDALYNYGAWEVDSGDLDGDGYTDLVFASYYTGSSYATTSYVYWGNSGGYSYADRTALVSYGARAVVAEDLDLDGWEDLFFAQYYSGSAYSFNSWLYWGSAAGYSTSDLSGLPTDGAWRAQAADMDEDGWTDLIVNCYYAGTFNLDSYVYYGSAAGYSSSNRDDLPADGPWGEAVVVGL
ncbi:MAG: MopE-related protein, partial [Pseudomonadota bacterium]